jgi:hypothetical protein
MGEQLPQIDRAALERIIQRAAELQTDERDIGESLTPDQVLALGREVGIPARYLQQALLEERTRLPDQPALDLFDRVIGPGTVSTHRVIRSDSATVERMLLRWMEQSELLCVQRQQPGRISWEPLSGLQAAIRRSTAVLNSGKRPFMLSRVATVSATITELEPGYSHAALAADVRPMRGAHVGTAAGAATVGIGATAALLVMSALLPVALLPLPLGLGLSYGALRRYRSVPARVLLGLERALDHLEQGTGKPARELPSRKSGLLDLLEEVRRSLKS